MTLAVLCAGAAKGLVAALGSAFTAETAVAIDGTFGAVGALREKLVAGAPCDAIVLTAALIDTLEKEGRVVPGSAAPLGTVRTGIAVRAGEPLPDIQNAAALRATLLGASRLLFPDPQRATAGIHFVDVLRRLGIHDDVALVGPLPAGFDLATVYTAAVCTGARDRALAQRYVQMLSGAQARGLRARGGFEC